MKISVFGGSQPKPGDHAYNEAQELGRLLAIKSHVLMTGGYMGTMEAVSKGASEAGGHVIGVTCEQIENWRPVKPNPWVKEERRRVTLIDRLVELVEACDAAIALPGGPGTLTEIALTWNLQIVNAIVRKPLILVGNGWNSVFQQMYTSLGSYTPDNQRELLVLVPYIQKAIFVIDSIAKKE